MTSYLNYTAFASSTPFFSPSSSSSSPYSQLHAGIPGSVFHVITTEDGHDGFLLEQDTVGQHIDAFLRNKTEPS